MIPQTDSPNLFEHGSSVKWSSFTPKDGFLCSKKECNYWQKWPHYKADKIQQECLQAGPKAQGNCTTHMDMHTRNSPLAGPFPFKRQRQPTKRNVSMAEHPKSSMAEHQMGRVTQITKDMESKTFFPHWEKQLQVNSSPTGPDSLLQPQNGSEQLQNGETCHGMGPLWTTLTFQGNRCWRSPQARK